MTSSATNCGNCRYSVEWNNSLRCHRHAPVVIVTDQIKYEGKQWPQVSYYSYCGDHEPLSPEANATESLIAFCTAIREERRECEKVATDHITRGLQPYDNAYNDACRDIAAAIRKRGAQ